jgi:hypothetical protein
MSAHQCLRTMIVALFGVLVLAIGPVALLAPTAAANPGGPLVTQVGDFPFDGQGIDDAPNKQVKLKNDDKGEKVEKLYGNVTTKVIDLIFGVIKCGLNIASPSVKCQL